jgi:hypothetical protein
MNELQNMILRWKGYQRIQLQFQKKLSGVEMG